MSVWDVSTNDDEEKTIDSTDWKDLKFNDEVKEIAVPICEHALHDIPDETTALKDPQNP